MASETAQRHVKEIVERDDREMRTLIRTSKDPDMIEFANEGSIYEIGYVSDEWNLFDENVFIVS